MYYASDEINLRWLFDLKPDGSICEVFGLNTLYKSVDLLFAFAQNLRSPGSYSEPKTRIKLTTYALRVRCSTTDLSGRVFSH